MKDGGNAFPFDYGGLEAMNAGMSLRDFFAAAALPAAFAECVQQCRETGWDENWRDGIARDSYAMADAMIKARDHVT